MQACVRARSVRGVTMFFAAVALAAPTASSAAVNGFEGGDADQAADCASATIDWRCLTEDQVLAGSDGSGALDDAFEGGSKETEPGAWSLKSASVHDKSDIVGTWSSVSGAGGRSFLQFAFHRAGNTGTTYLGIELNQATAAWTNAAGATIPCRTDGDVLVSYEVSNPPAILVYGWSGTGPAECPDGAAGSWNLVSVGPSGFEAAMNFGAGIDNFLRPGGVLFSTGTFGEAAVDLRAVADAVGFAAPCEYFRRVSVKSRSSDSITASLNDWVAPVAISARACETPVGDTTAPQPPAISSPVTGAAQATDDVALVGIAEPGSTVTVYDGPASVGFATADASGNWTLTIVDAAEGTHSYVAEATDDAGNTSAPSNAVSVTIDLPDPLGPPAPPSMDGAASGSTVMLTGTAAPGATVTILENGVVVGSATADAAGSYSVVLTDVTAGSHTYTATATNGAGTSPQSAPVTVAVAPAPDPTPDPTPTASPDPTPTASPDPTPTASPDPTPTATPDPAPTPTETADPTPTAIDPSAPAGATPGGAAVAPAEADAGTGASVLATSVANATFRGSRVVLGEAAEMRGCANKRFKAHVTLKGVRRARFMVDGRPVRVVRRADRNGHFVATIDPAKLRLAPGPHKLAARVTFRNRRRRARTVALRFRRCDVCQSRRAFRIRAKHLRGGERAVSASVFVNGRRVKVLRGKRLRARVVLTGLPKGRFTVLVKIRTNRGRTVNDVRRYKTCTRKGG